MIFVLSKCKANPFCRKIFCFLEGYKYLGAIQQNSIREIVYKTIFKISLRRKM